MARLGYDGDNVVRTGSDINNLRWTFVHGPGTDDPLIGYQDMGGGANPRILYWVTDGNGRQYAVGDSTGNNYADNFQYTTAGKYAGGTQQAHSFEAERNGDGTMAGLSFFRNRY